MQFCLCIFIAISNRFNMLRACPYDHLYFYIIYAFFRFFCCFFTNTNEPWCLEGWWRSICWIRSFLSNSSCSSHHCQRHYLWKSFWGAEFVNWRPPSVPHLWQVPRWDRKVITSTFKHVTTFPFVWNSVIGYI